MWVDVTLGSWEIGMDSPINGEGSCAGCHGLEADSNSVGRVYLFPQGVATTPNRCP